MCLSIICKYKYTFRILSLSEASFESCNVVVTFGPLSEILRCGAAFFIYLFIYFFIYLFIMLHKVILTIESGG